MRSFQTPVPLTKEHHRQSFDCGKAPLNTFLSSFALVNQSWGSARTYVSLVEGEIAGYFSLAPGSVAFDLAPSRITRGQARHEVPVILMARFAVDLRFQGLGLGRSLFLNALARSLQATELIGGRAFLVHAKDEEAVAFYGRFEMVATPGNPRHMYLLFKDVRRLLELV